MAKRGQKITEELEAKILAMAAEGTSQRQIAKILGISVSTVNRVVKGKGVSEDLLEHFEQVRTQKKQEFVTGAFDSIKGARSFMDKRIKAADEGQDKLLQAIDMVRALMRDIETLLKTEPATVEARSHLTMQATLYLKMTEDLVEVIKSLKKVAGVQLGDVNNYIGILSDKVARLEQLDIERMKAKESDKDDDAGGDEDEDDLLL
ncbi:transposase family protein [Aneurinibacillus thermoaerophilus]|uniref:transposase family protein n=1 Tax=Aneurinibacillus thermoaerophilus TaxID=143495 RepID=UPI002E21645D|nr:transposase family protein [Aneurinibacillus thermoaerophilus]MED0765525.1 transposase family protein [Aneurinibacillus thermoaerophilus]